MCNIIAVSGAKNSGKTTLIENLIGYFNSMDISCAVIKHDGHSFFADTEGTDTSRFFHAGAFGTAIFDGEKYQLIERKKIAEAELLEQFSKADIIFLEGFKYSDYPKLWICSNESIDGADNIIAWIGGNCEPNFKRDEMEKIGEFLLGYFNLSVKGGNEHG